MIYFNTELPSISSKTRQSFQESDFLSILQSDSIASIIERHTPAHRERIFTPIKALSMFIKQALNFDRSCANAVNEFIIDNINVLPKNISKSTGSYCRSRKKLPLALIKELVQHTGAAIKEKTPHHNNIKGGIYLVDGTTFSLPDTIENQAEYPQQSTQKAGLGFPICRALGIFCLESGAVINAKMAAYKGKGANEHSMLRAILDTFKKGDLVIGDALYSSYWILAYLKMHGINGIFQQGGGRAKKTDFRTGKRIGKYDHIISYDRPQRPKWMADEQYKTIPKSIELRELRDKHKTIITTLMDPDEHSKADISDMYKSRWNIEVDFRNLKTTMGMSTLSCKSPEMCEKEMWVYFLANNIIRILMAQTAKKFELKIRSISFKNTLQIWNAISSKFKNAAEVIEDFLFLIAGHQVGKRPGRVEPRAKKRRASSYSLLMVPRHIARAAILRKGHPPKQRKNTGARGGKA
ncbi:MAG: IS4 family transposase [Pseudomonadales bacterium]|nr:IS4 family transposase [Pseudomonadales bacterium]